MSVAGGNESDGSPGNSNTASALAWAVAGAAVGGAAVAAIAYRTRSTTTERAMAVMTQQLRHDLRSDIANEVKLSAIQTTSHVGTSLQSQERELGKQLTGHYQTIHDRLQPVAAVSREMQGLTLKMQNLENIFLSPKKRGAFGEQQLEAIIQDSMHQQSYDFQYTLSNGKRPDCVLHLPSPIGALAIDSKFPLDAFQQLDRVVNGADDANGSATASGAQNDTAKQARSKIEEALKKHIKDIHDKYIIAGETAECAILFLPSESIFAQVVQEHPAILSFANQQRVWLACPTTLMAVLTTLRGVVRGMALSNQTEELLGEVSELSKDVERLGTRFEKAQKSVDAAKENLRLLQISMDKIQRRKFKLDVLDGFEGRPALETTLGDPPGGELPQVEKQVIVGVDS
jgi:DNA recombination protein RmuC